MDLMISAGSLGRGLDLDTPPPPPNPVSFIFLETSRLPGVHSSHGEMQEGAQETSPIQPAHFKPLFTPCSLISHWPKPVTWPRTKPRDGELHSPAPAPPEVQEERILLCSAITWSTTTSDTRVQLH